MAAGRPKKADPGTLYAFAHQFYWDLKRVNEGYSRWEVDEEQCKQLVADIDAQEIRLSDNQNIAIARAVVRDVRDGHLPEAERNARLTEAAASTLFVTRDWLHREVVEIARKEVKVPGRPDVIETLLQAQTSEEVRIACRDAFILRTISTEPGLTKQVPTPNWPIPAGSVLPGYLSQYANEFIAAKKDRRFPHSDRHSSLPKQLWFLSRALAGALYGVKTRTAVNLVGSKRPEEVFQESGDCKPRRNRFHRYRRS
jgi:hypothetical protein